MDHVGILKNAFQTTIRYRALWVLGFIWALVGGSGSFSSAPNPGASGSGYTYETDLGLQPPFDPFVPGAILTAVVVLCCLMFFIMLAMIVLNYVLRAGVYRTLHNLDADGAKPTVRGGFREGWNRRTWRLFFQDLIIWLPFVIVILALLIVVALPLLALISDSGAVNTIGVIMTIGLFLLWLAFVIVSGIVLGLLSQFWGRASAIDDRSVSGGIKAAWMLFRNNLTDVVIMWLLMLGIGILWALIMIPIVLIVLAISGVIAGGPGYLIYSATQSIAGALLWGVPVFLLLFVIPMTFIGGLYLIFQTSVWNQMYDRLVERTESTELATA